MSCGCKWACTCYGYNQLPAPQPATRVEWTGNIQVHYPVKEATK